MKKWRECELLYLQAHYPTNDSREIAKHLGKSHNAVRAKATVLGLVKISGPGYKKKWTDEENERVKQEYPLGEVKALAASLNTTVLSLYHHARALGVKRDESLMQEINRELGRKLAECDASIATRIKPGQVSFNKGRKQTEYMSAESIERTKATRFKPGLKTHNRVPVGTEREAKDGYIQVKVRDHAGNKNYEFKHRIVYEENFGPVPAGHIVEFIDGNVRNFSPDNLRAVTRGENAVNNLLKDSAILKRFFKITDPDEIEYWKVNHADVIDLKRKEIQINGTIAAAKKKSNGR